MKKITTIIALTLAFGLTISSCTTSSKSCKKNQKKVKSMRKSGALKM